MATVKPTAKKKTTKAPASARKMARPRSVDAFVACAPADKRASLRALRSAIRAAAPDAVEGISYGMAGYKYSGKALVYFAWAKEHVGFYGPIATYTSTHPDEFTKYSLDKGTLRFATGQAIPAALVAKIVKARMKEIDASR